VLKLFIALHHFLCKGLELTLRMLRRTSRADEMPFALALTLELNWLSLEQHNDLEVFGSRDLTMSQRLPAKVVDISKYLPERPLRHRLVKPTPPPQQPRWRWATACIIVMAYVALLPSVFVTADLSAGEYVTGIGEHRTIPLADGSRIVMNTQSRLLVRLSARHTVQHLPRQQRHQDRRHAGPREGVRKSQSNTHHPQSGRPDVDRHRHVRVPAAP
jgi:hypothetical protein